MDLAQHGLRFLIVGCVPKYRDAGDALIAIIRNFLGDKGESNPCFLSLCPRRSRNGFIGEDLERVSRHGNAWMALDVISFVIRCPALRPTETSRGSKSAGIIVSLFYAEVTDRFA